MGVTRSMLRETCRRVGATALEARGGLAAGARGACSPQGIAGVEQEGEEQETW